MGVQTKFDNARAALRKPPAEHPCAIPPIPGGQGLWLIRQGEAAPLGYVRQRPVTGGFAFDVYAHCRDGDGRRPWLHTAASRPGPQRRGAYDESRRAGPDSCTRCRGGATASVET